MFYSFDENGICVFSSPNNITGDMIESDIDEDITDIIYKDGTIRKMTEEEKEEFYPEQSNISDIELLKAQIQVISDRNDFIEDCIAEMAMEVYQ